MIKRFGSAPLLVALCCSPLHGDSFILDFNSTVGGTILDSTGQGTGFTHRIPGSGIAISVNDPNLNLDTTNGHLLITSTRSDFNTTGFGRNLTAMEAPSILINGIGSEDFIVRARFLDVHVDQLSDQVGVFVGASVDNVLRGGVHETATPGVYQSIFNLSLSGVDGPPQGTHLAAFTSGQDAEVELGRINGLWHFSWKNLDTSDSGTTSGFSVPSLDAESNLYFGVFNHDARNTTPQVATLDRFEILTGASIPEPAALVLLLMAIALRLAGKR